MLIVIGTKVRFINTGDEGVVRSFLSGGMLSIYIPADDMEIPAFPEDLMPAEEYQQAGAKTKAPGKKEKPVPQPPPFSVETQYAIIRSQGIQLVFDPVADLQGTVGKYSICLLNDTQYELLFSIAFYLNRCAPQKWEGSLASLSWQELGTMLYDDLNEAPEFDIKCRWSTTEGLGEPVGKNLRIKAKSFFSHQKTAPLLNKKVHLFHLFEKPETAKAAEEDLQSYTRRHAKPGKEAPSRLKKLSIYDSKELAEFEREIDLHIDKLTSSLGKMTNSEILHLQIEAFEKYIQKAIRLGVPRVFVIHGVGQGKLKDVIATKLLQNPDVQTFKNEYHNRYGWGATEVIF